MGRSRRLFVSNRKAGEVLGFYPSFNITEGSKLTYR